MNPPMPSDGLKRLAAIVPWVALAVAGVILPGVPSGCRPSEPTPGHQPLSPSVPAAVTIRVLLGTDAPTSVIIATTGGYRLRLDGRILSRSAGPLGPTSVSRNGQTWQFNEMTATGRQVSLEPSAGSFVRCNQKSYRGSLRLVAHRERDIAAINHVNLESYLAGVLAKELYPSWHIEAYRALAVAARTFAVYHIKTDGKARDYDVTDGQSSQVYGGLAAETHRAWDAVQDTIGQILVCERDGRDWLFMAQYSSCCGGITNGAEVIRNAPQAAPLAGGVQCNDCTGSSRYRWPTVRVPKSDIFAALARAYEAVGAMDGVDRIEVASQTPYGRAVWVDIIAPNSRSIRIRAEDLRLALLRARVPSAAGLYSMNCRIRNLPHAVEFHDGRGFGHGVGLCQWGAAAKADKGFSAGEILRCYYPGAKLICLY